MTIYNNWKNQIIRTSKNQNNLVCVGVGIKGWKEAYERTDFKTQLISDSYLFLLIANNYKYTFMDYLGKKTKKMAAQMLFYPSVYSAEIIKK